MAIAIGIRYSFNTQPPEGGCDKSVYGLYKSAVSTHSRLKAAVPAWNLVSDQDAVSTHSRLKAAEHFPVW